MSSKGIKLKRTLENRILKGRGEGERESYLPFIQAHDNKVASEGWLTRHLGWKTKRIHHTLSDHERDYLYYLKEDFFLEQGIDWRIITESSLPKTLIRNVDWLCEAKYLDNVAGCG
jgi:hypothetical protein